VASQDKEAVMESQNVKLADRNVRAVETLRRLDELGAIKLDVLLSKSAEIKNIVNAGGGGGGAGVALDDWERICYPFIIRIGPRDEFDLVSVASELSQLGFDVRARRG
jgi:hypothetical protein